MSYASNVTSDVLGAQEPRVYSIAPYVSTTGDEAAELADHAGLHLDPWQRWYLKHLLGERVDGSWAAFQAGLCVSRQNGKGSILEARELAGLFLLDERLIIHSAHQFDTSLEAFLRLQALVEARDDFTRRIKRISRAHGEEGIELYGPKGRRTSGGQRIRFRTRTKGGGRGFSGDCLMLDEAMILPTMFHGAILPILSARPNPQVIYTGSAVDQQVHEHGIVFARLRERGIEGTNKRLFYAEWSPDITLEQAMDDDVSGDLEIQAEANPGLGIRITTEYVESERDALDARSFAVERLGTGDWPSTQVGGDQKISLQTWRQPELIDRKSKVEDPVCLSFDVTPDRSWASIGVAGDREDRLGHLEVIEHRRTTNWLVERIVDLTLEHDPVAIVWDTRSPAASLETKLRAALEDAGVQMTIGDHDLLVPVGAGDLAAACGMLFDEVDQKTIRHGDQPELATAIKGAVARMLGDEAWVWSRKSSAVDISPLVAVTLARWGHQTHQPPVREPMVAFR